MSVRHPVRPAGGDRSSAHQTRPTCAALFESSTRLSGLSAEVLGGSGGMSTACDGARGLLRSLLAYGEMRWARNGVNSRAAQANVGARLGCVARHNLVHTSARALLKACAALGHGSHGHLQTSETCPRYRSCGVRKALTPPISSRDTKPFWSVSSSAKTSCRRHSEPRARKVSVSLRDACGHQACSIGARGDSPWSGTSPPV